MINDSQPETKNKKQPLSLSSQAVTKKPTGRVMSQVCQSFSHGRSKSVAVEVKRKRSNYYNSSLKKSMNEGESFSSSKLTVNEQDTRLKALKEALSAPAEPLLPKETGFMTQTIPTDSEESLPLPPLSDDILYAPSSPPDLSIPDLLTHKNEPEKQYKDQDLSLASSVSEKRKSTKTEPGYPSPSSKRHEKRANLKKMSMNQILEYEDLDKKVRSSGRRNHKKRSSSSPLAAQKVTRDVVIPDFISVQELASRMAERGSDVIKTLISMGVMTTITQMIDSDTAELVVSELGHRSTRVSDSDIEAGLKGPEDTPDQLEDRAPVVTVMGHVDHGKTSLLDALRKTNVASHEAGGITQHIGAYQVALPSGKKITFIDTPGHAAFTQMRARGANATDIIVLVVAADDGVKAQTVEAINHARSANVPIIIAINKIDKPSANPNNVRQLLLEHNVILEELGGDILDVEVSAKTGLNLDKLEDVILLQAEILNLKANPNRQATGVIIEAQFKKGQGAVATVLIQRGTLKVGDIFVSGQQYGRVRTLVDDWGNRMNSASPSVPVAVSGFTAPPQAGDDFIVVESESKAREVSCFREQQFRAQRALRDNRHLSMESFFNQKIQQENVKELPIVIKCDVQGTLEALVNGLEKLSTAEVKARILHGAVGAITETDVMLAKSSKAIILGFNVRATPQARQIAHHESIAIRYYSVIYQVLEDITMALTGLLAPTFKESILGTALVRQVFNITKVGKIAGCIISEGLVRRGTKVRLLRDHVVIHEGYLKTLKRLKDEVKEVREGYECGIAFENYQDLRDGDIVECFELEEIRRTL